MSRRAAAWTLGGLAALGLIVALASDPLPQDRAYHSLADGRSALGVPNALDVISNAPFLVVGIAGLVFLVRRGRARADGPLTQPWERLAWGVFFAGVAGTALGSAWYHLAPDTDSLFWDRLPMAVAFGALLATVIGERLDMRAGRMLLIPIVLASVGSVVWWRLTERAGAGDLRPYGVVQYGSIAAIIAMTLVRPPGYTFGRGIYEAVAFYALAKVLESLDRQVYELGGIVSGHTLKHLAAAAAVWRLLVMLRRRRPVRIDPVPA